MRLILLRALIIFRHWGFILEVDPIWLIGAEKTYRASQLRSIEQTFRIMNAGMKKAPPISLAGPFTLQALALFGLRFRCFFTM